MEITGKVVKILPDQSGEGRNGTWVKQSFVVETEDQYPKQICIDAWGDRVNEVKELELGERVRVSIDLQSREWKDKWFTDVKAWRIEKADAAQAQQPARAASSGGRDIPPPREEDYIGGQDDDLPF